MYYYPENFIKSIPKTDLHLHLDGSLRLSTLIETAKENKIELPSYTESGLKETVFKERYQDLGEYLQGFQYTMAVLQTPETLERAAYELAMDNINEGVYYIEPRFAPQQHISDELDFESVLLAVNKGLEKAQKEHNHTEEVKNGGKPEFHFGIIVCAMRMFLPVFSDYFNKLFHVHRFSTNKEIYGMASLELAKAAVATREKHHIPIVGFDLAGQEKGYPPTHHQKAYHYCHRYFLKKTVHAGEAYGAESIFQAITDLYANRIGHGYYLFDTEKIEDPAIIDKEKYINELSNYIADRRITIEVCLTSNLQTNPRLKDIKDHSFQKMLDYGFSATLCTDNRLVSNTSVSNEVELAVNNFDITPKRLRDIIIYGFKRSFFWGSYKEKRSYCRDIIDYYDKVNEKYKTEIKEKKDE